LAAKTKTAFVCSSCQHQESKWLGRCPECGSWNSFREAAGAAAPKAAAREREAEPIPLASIETREGLRLDAGSEEVNRVLGGGIMKESAVLIAGEPGTGKSTLMLQLAARIRTRGRVLYVSGEESPAQIRLRAGEGHGGNPQRVQRDGRQRDGRLLAGGQQHVHLALVGQGHDFLGQLDQVVRHPAHSGDNDYDLVAFGAVFGHAGGDILDAVGVAHRRPAVFLDD
jgi:hypothetical protein